MINFINQLLKIIIIRFLIIRYKHAIIMEINMSEVSNEVLSCFWLPPTYYRTCVSGVNKNTIIRKGDDIYSERKQRHFEIHVLPMLRNQITPYPASMKYLPKSKIYADGFRDVVNDALREIYAKRKGYVFSKEQLIEILKFVPGVKVSYCDDVYFVKN